MQVSNYFEQNDLTLTGGVAIRKDKQPFPELRYTQANGTALCSFPLAVSEYNKQTGQTTSFYVEAVFWGKLAEIVSSQVQRGMQVTVWGKLKVDSWTGKCQGCSAERKNQKTQIIGAGFSPVMSKDQRAQWSARGGISDDSGYTPPLDPQRPAATEDYDIGDLGPPLDLDAPISH